MNTMCYNFRLFDISMLFQIYSITFDDQNAGPNYATNEFLANLVHAKNSVLTKLRSCKSI